MFPNDEIEICITNIVGHIVKKSVFHRKGSIDTSEFPNGIYYVSFKTEKETKVLKLVRN
ncbi:MAG: T9SS type A sorting domain-containing protein [Sphingobacteriaceae bacterium]|nr:T9SS type A sorting domain-containing protein [Sphingobacteriaceae bacterium]